MSGILVNKNNSINKNDTINIYGIHKPKIIIQEGRNFTIVKETLNKDDSKNVAVISYDISDNKKDLKITNNIDKDIKNNLLGGNSYYHKYLKYKTKYLNLKNKLSF